MERGRHLSLHIAADASFHRFCVPCYVQEEQDQAVLARKQMNSDQWRRENFFTPGTWSLMQRVCVITDRNAKMGDGEGRELDRG